LETVQAARFRFGVFDIALLLALHAVAINGTLELYRGESFDRDPRGGLRALGTPPPPEPPVVAVIGGGTRFTAFWLRRFAAWVAAGVLGIWISFLTAALVLRNAGPHLRRAGPRLAAALACLLVLAALAGISYLCTHPESYIEINGSQIHPVIHAAWWAIGPAAAVMGVVVAVEIANGVAALRRRRLT
jgi:hypothetical protein